MQVFGHDIFTSGGHVHGLNLREVTRLRVAGLGMDAALNPYSGGAPVLRGNARVPALWTADEFDWQLFANGTRIGVFGSADYFPLADVQGDFLRTVDIVGTLRERGTDQWSSSNLFYARPIGDKVLLEWTDAPDDADFASYKIYWDEGDGLGADVLLETIAEKDVRSHIVTGLASGTYVFKILYADVWGNIGNGVGGDNSEIATAIVTAPPNAPTIGLNGLAAADLGTGQSWAHTFTLTAPVVATGIVGYAWAINQSPLDGELFAPETEFKRMIHVGTAAPNLAILGLYTGHWRLAAFAVDRYGNVSLPSSELAFTLVSDGAGGLTYVAGAGAARIIDITATPAAAGDITVTVTASVDPTTGGVSIERDGAEIDDIAYTATGIYETTDTGLFEGTEYTYRARGYDAALAYGEYSQEVTATSDATPPEGDQLLTAEVYA